MPKQAGLYYRVQLERNASPRTSISQLDILPIKHVVAQIKPLEIYTA